MWFHSNQRVCRHAGGAAAPSAGAKYTSETAKRILRALDQLGSKPDRAPPPQTIGQLQLSAPPSTSLIPKFKPPSLLTDPTTAASNAAGTAPAFGGFGSSAAPYNTNNAANNSFAAPNQSNNGTNATNNAQASGTAAASSGGGWGASFMAANKAAADALRAEVEKSNPLSAKGSAVAPVSASGGGGGWGAGFMAANAAASKAATEAVRAEVRPCKLSAYLVSLVGVPVIIDR